MVQYVTLMLLVRILLKMAYIVNVIIALMGMVLTVQVSTFDKLTESFFCS